MNTMSVVHLKRGDIVCVHSDGRLTDEAKEQIFNAVVAVSGNDLRVLFLDGLSVTILTVDR